MFLHRRWIKIGFIALSVVAGWRLSFWMPQPIVNAQETAADKATPKSAEEQAEAEQLKRVEALSQFLKKLYPDRPLQVVPVGEAVLLRGDVRSPEIQKQIVEISEQFYPKVLNQMRPEAAKSSRQSDRASSEVPAGMAVMSIPFATTMTSAGVIRPGDKVDVMMTKATANARGAQGIPKETKPVLENVEVFAIDGKRETFTPTTGDSKPKNISLLVTVEQTTQLKLARDVGELHVTLRSGQADAAPV